MGKKRIRYFHPVHQAKENLPQAVFCDQKPRPSHLAKRTCDILFSFLMMLVPQNAFDTKKFAMLEFLLKFLIKFSLSLYFHLCNVFIE